MNEAELKKVFDAKKQRILTGKNGKTTIREGFTQATSFEMFKKWFETSKFDEGCRYCHTTNERSKELFELRKAATRGGKRGKRLELDRKDPYKPYDELSNLVWSCYWCNNAKTNFFSEEEFKPIGEAIGEVLKGLK